MPAFVIVEASISDADAYEAYKKLTPGSLTTYGGEFMIRGGKTISLEGGWSPERIVMIRFPSLSQAEEWWHSEGYQTARKLRLNAANVKMIAVEGV